MIARDVRPGDMVKRSFGAYEYTLRVTKTYTRRGSCMADVHPAHQGPINLGPLGGTVSRDISTITRDDATIYERDKP
jgi:hypothetical protein